MKNKILMYLVLMILSTSMVLAYSVSSVDRAGVVMQEVKYEPYPADPGAYLDVWLKVENFGGSDAKNFEVELLPAFPFSLDVGAEATRAFGTVLGHQTVLVKYKVRIDQNAVEGTNPLKFRYRHDSADHWKYSQVDVFIRTVDANIAVNEVKIDRIAQGVASPVEISLENLADSTLTNINVKLDLTGTDTPFVPIDSTAEKKLANIEPGVARSVTFNLMALPDADSGVYKVPIEITATDGTGRNYTKSSIIGLIIGSDPELSITVDSSMVYDTGETGDVVLKFVNKGLNDVKLMSVTLDESSDYDIISKKEVYIGNIDSDDYETAEFRLKVRKAKKGVTTLKLKLNYLDANNKQYQENVDVALRIISAKKLGLNEGSAASRLVGFILVVVIGYFVYKRWEKKKKKKQAGKK
ncbi:COG1361 S-layer family protein [Nanoarchaeota archaeon]